MADRIVPVTREGMEKLRAELEQFKERRRDVAEKIRAAQAQGTSQADAEYDDAKIEQGMVEGRIRDLEDTLSRARVIDESTAHTANRVQVGSGVEVEQNGQVRHYQIVGPPEANPAQGRISNESPVGSALLGRAVGDTVEVNAPSGVVKISVLKID